MPRTSHPADAVKRFVIRFSDDLLLQEAATLLQHVPCLAFARSTRACHSGSMFGIGPTGTMRVGLIYADTAYSEQGEQSTLQEMHEHAGATSNNAS